MPKKKKMWQLATWLPRKRKRKAKKRGNVNGNIVAQKEKGKKRAMLLPKEERRKKKKFNLNLGYLCKMHLSALFPPHFPPKLGG